MTRQQTVRQVEELMRHYCNGCFLHKHYVKEKGRRFAHRYCITQCTVGNEIKKLGEKLT